MVQEIKLSGKLEEKTSLIKHYLKAWSNNIIAVGKELKEIQDSKIYKENFKSFEEYVENTFDFKKSYAYNFIKVYEKYGQNSNRLEKVKDYGMRVLILSLSVPDDYIDEVMGEIKSNPEIKSKEAARILKRFSNQVGAAPRHSESLNPIQRREEHVLKLKREADIIKEKFDEFKQIKTDLKDSIRLWLDSAGKFNGLEALKEDLKIIELELK